MHDPSRLLPGQVVGQPATDLAGEAVEAAVAH